MSRTDELRRGGAKERGGGGGGTPFVKWGERYAWVEGDILKLWEGKYGKSATVRVTRHSDDIQAAGKTEEGEKYIRPIAPGQEVNVGLNYAALEGAVTDSDEGRRFHFAFEGWGESKNGDRYRVFTVLELPEDEGGAAAEDEPEGETVRSEAGPGHPDSDLPF